MPKRGRAGLVSRVLVISVCALLPAAALAQQAGHGTVPTTGPAAPGGFQTAEREADPVLARIEELRRALAELARQYKKTKAAARAESQPDVLVALGRAQREVDAARERVGQ